jgi:ferritin-like metal-binding protein YciE
MSIRTAVDKFMHDLGDIYDAEQRFLRGQQEMVSQASDGRLQKLIQVHIGETEEQIKNLEKVFELMGKTPQAQECPGARGLVEEAERMLAETEDPALKDTVIGGAATKVEHYELVSYQDLVESAQLMGNKEAARLLEKNRKQEERTAQKLERAAPKLMKKAVAI